MIRFGSLLWGSATLAILVACYTVSLKASGERKAVDDLRVQIAGDLRGIRTLQAEFRTRARPSELQRWNDEVLGLQAATTLQFVRDPMQLAAFETHTPALPVPRYAVAEAPKPKLAPVQTVAYRADTDAVPAPTIAAVDSLVGEGEATLQRVALR